MTPSNQPQSPQPQAIKRRGQHPLQKLYRTPRFKHQWALSWWRELQEAVKHKAADREVAINARHLVTAAKAAKLTLQRKRNQ